MKISEPAAWPLVQSASLPGRRSLRVAFLREMSFSWRRRMRSSARSTTKSSSLLACAGLPASQWSNGSLIAFSTMRWRFGGGEAVLGLALELRLADEHREHAAGADHDVFAGDRGGALALADALGVVLQPAQQRGAQAGFVGAAVRRRNGVAVGVEEAVGVGGPGHRPLRGAMRAGLAGAAGEDVGMDQRRVLQRLGEIVLQPFLEMERGLLRHVVPCREQFLGAGPADFDAAEQIGLRARHLEHALGLEMRLGAENLRVGVEAHLGAAAVRRLAGFCSLPFGLPRSNAIW